MPAESTEHTKAETVEIGYREDGVIWLTAGRSTPTAAHAARELGEAWRVVAETWLRPTGEAVNSKDDEWEDCGHPLPGARPGWKLVNTTMGTLFPDIDLARPNPYYEPGTIE